MSNTRLKKKAGKQWPDIAEALDALGSAADLSAFAEQYHKILQLSRDRDRLAAAPFCPQLLTVLTHVVSSALLLVHQLNPRRARQLPPAAAGCFISCIDTYCHLVKVGTTTERTLSQLRTYIAESGLLPAMIKAATRLKAAAFHINSPSPSSPAATAKSSNIKPGPLSTAAEDISTISARDQSCDHSAAATGRGSATAVQPSSSSSSAAAGPSCKLPTASALPLTSAAPTDSTSAAAAAPAEAAGSSVSEVAVAVEDPYDTLNKGLMLLYTHIILPVWDAPAEHPLGSPLQEVTVALAGLVVKLLQLYGGTAPPPASAPVTAAHRASPSLAATSTGTDSISGWQSNEILWVCINGFAETMLIGYESRATGIGRCKPGDALALHLSADAVNIALWVAASAADALQMRGSSSSRTGQIADSRPAAAAAAAQAATSTAKSGSIGAGRSASMLNSLSPARAMLELLPWRCKASVGKPLKAFMWSTRFLLEALHYRSQVVPAGTAARYGPNPTGGPGLNPCKVLKPELVAPLMATVIGVFVSEPPSSKLYTNSVLLIILLGELMSNQAILVTPAVAAEAYSSIVRHLVCRLLPHMQQLLRDSGPATDLVPEPAAVQRVLLNVIIEALQLAGTKGCPDSFILELADLLRSQPSLAAATLESALRSEALHQPERLRDGAVVGTVTRLVMHAIYSAPQRRGSTGLGLGEPAVAANQSTLEGCEGSLAAAALADPQLARQVFALIVTCLKCTKLCSHDCSMAVHTAAAAAAAAVTLSNQDDLRMLQSFDLAADMEGMVTYMVRDSAVTEIASSVSTQAAADLAPVAADPATNATASRPCIVLAARSLYVLGTHFQSSYWHQVVSADNQSAVAALGSLDAVVTAAFFSNKLMQWLGYHIPAIGLEGELEAAQKALQHLLSQQQELHTKLKAITSRLGPALKTQDYDTALACVRQLLSGPAEHLKQFGALVCAELPVTGCCANPECQSASVSGELLQGNKCSSCRVVTYCGVGCQRQHWKLHKPVCARFKASNK